MRRSPALGSWLSQAWHAAGPEIAAVAAVATGNPELAIPAAQAAAAAGGGKPNPPKAVQPVQAVQAPPQGFGAAFASLTPLDREIVVVGGAVLGAVVLGKILFGRPAYGRR